MFGFAPLGRRKMRQDGQRSSDVRLRTLRLRRGAIDAQLAVAVTPAERFERAGQIAETGFVECGGDLLLRLRVQQRVQVHCLPGADGFVQVAVNRSLLDAAEPCDLDRKSVV